MKDEPRLIQQSLPREKVALAIVLVALWVSYFPSLGGEFLWDDPDYIVNNENLRSLSGLANIWLRPSTSPQYYPLTFSSFWIEYQMFGDDPRIFRATNLVLHSISAILLFRLLKKLEIPGALLAAGIFALHPVMVESVAWITERKNTLSLLFYLASAEVFLCRVCRHDARSGRSLAMALLFFTAALLSKSVTATLPAAMLVLLWWRQGTIRRIDIVRTIPFFVIGIVLALNTVRIEAVHVGADASRIPELDWSIPDRLLIAGRVPWFYLFKLLVPVNLSFIYPRWDVDPTQLWQWVFPIGLAMTIAILFAFRRRIGRGPLAAVLVFTGTLFPVLGFVAVYPMRFSYVADHFQYHACIAAIVLFSAAAVRMPLPALWTPMLLVVLVGLTWNRTHVYRNTLTLWRDTWMRNPDSWMVNANLGHVYLDMGIARRDAQSMEMAKSLYLRARDLNPHWHETHLLVGTILMLEGNLDGAEEALKKASELNPDHAMIWFKRGEVARRQQRWDDAIRAYHRALQIYPGYDDARKGLMDAQAATQPSAK